MSFFKSDKPDIWLVCTFGIPIGIVEVKSSLATKPPLQDPENFGQIYDYMKQMKEYFGRCCTFGILTTYYEWRIVWLPHNSLVEANALPPSSIPNCGTLVQGPQYDLAGLSTPNWDEDKPLTFSSVGVNLSGDIAELSLTEDAERVLHGTNIIHWNDPVLAYMLVSLVRKMIASKVLPVKISLAEPIGPTFMSQGTRGNGRKFDLRPNHCTLFQQYRHHRLKVLFSLLILEGVVMGGCGLYQPPKDKYL